VGQTATRKKQRGRLAGPRVRSSFHILRQLKLIAFSEPLQNFPRPLDPAEYLKERPHEFM
jgi:hypothetical protein